MTPNNDVLQEFPALAAAIAEMDRAERKARKAIERYEVPYGHDAPIWATIDTNGERVSTHEWFVKMPSDALTDRLDQAQKYLLAIASEIRRTPEGTERHVELRRRHAEQNEKINVIQLLLLHPQLMDT
jgi:hypothetical protein